MTPPDLDVKGVVLLLYRVSVRRPLFKRLMTYVLVTHCYSPLFYSFRDPLHDR